MKHGSQIQIIIIYFLYKKMAFDFCRSDDIAMKKIIVKILDYKTLNCCYGAVQNLKYIVVANAMLLRVNNIQINSQKPRKK